MGFSVLTRLLRGAIRSTFRFLYDHAPSFLLGTIAGLALIAQVWHGQAAQSIAIYQGYESSPSVHAIDRLSFEFDELIKGVTRNSHELYMPFLHDRIASDSEDLTFNVSKIGKILHSAEHCYHHKLFLTVYFLTGCHQRVMRMLLGEHIIDTFFTIRTYVYCDPNFKTYFPEIDGLEKFMMHLLKKEYGQARRIFLTSWQRRMAIDDGRVKESKPFVVIRISPERCEKYYRTMNPVVPEISRAN